MNKILRKTVLLALAAITALATLTTLSACGKSDEEVIREGLTEGFNTLKDTSSEDFKGVSDSVQATLTAQGIEIDNFMGVWLEGYDFTIGQITVTGSTATAEVTIMVKQFGPILDAVISEVQNSGKNYDTMAAATDAISKLLAEKLASAQLSATTVSVACAKTGNQWDISSNLEQEVFMPALYGTSRYA